MVKINFVDKIYDSDSKEWVTVKNWTQSRSIRV